MLSLLEEQNELVRENSQLLGEVLEKLDTIANKETYVNVQPGATHLTANHTEVKNLLTEDKKERGPVPKPDAVLFDEVITGHKNFDGSYATSHFETDVFWPTGKANPGWVRVKVTHPSKESLSDRLEKGCLCGKPIVLKELNGDKFWSCEALTKKGSCPYRPAAYFDKLTFLCNLPPAK